MIVWNFVRKLLGLAPRPEAEVHPAVAIMLGLQAPVESLQAATAMLASASTDDRRRAAHALGTFGDRTASPLLLGALGDADKLVRICAVQSLGRLGEIEAVPPLCELVTRDGVPWLVVSNAIKVLGELRDARAVSVLTGLLKSPDAFVRHDAAFALGELGHPDAIPALEAVRSDKAVPERTEEGTAASRSVGKQARLAIKKIRSRA